MNHLHLFFFSGTGNSFTTAAWIAEQAEGRGTATNLEGMTRRYVRPFKPGTLLGLVYPTHGFTAPWRVLTFACGLPHGNGTRAFCLPCRAGLKFGPVHPPGIAGTAGFLIALILFLKGYTVLGTTSLDMPSNWFSLHPIQKRKTHRALIDRARPLATRFARRILSGKRVWLTKNNLYEGLLGLLLAPISALYLLAGRFFLAKLFFANPDCTGCGLCAANCPVGAIDMRASPPRPFWTHKCESCMRCAGFCPEHAVEAGHSWGVLLYLITTVPVGTMLLARLGAPLGLGPVLDFLWLYPSLFLSYRLFTLLIRIRIVNRLFTLTTFTHLRAWGRYRAPGITIRDLHKTQTRK